MSIPRSKHTYSSHRRLDNHVFEQVEENPYLGATKVLRVVNDLFLFLSKGNISVLALLDFSSAFDTIDHPILVHCLHTAWHLPVKNCTK